ncbi:MAG: PHB depolymerase family esterase [Steroidobacteraceae bacterium]
MPSCRRAASWLLAVACLTGALPAADAAGVLRERLRDRIAARAAPPPVPATLLGPAQPIIAPGRYEIRLRVNGAERFALVHVPALHQPGRPMPLVMALHGGGGGAVYQADDATYGLISKSEQAGFIAVFPNGTSATKNGMLATWNAGNCCARARDEQVDDVAFLRAVVADVARRIEVAPQRVYAIGMSNGGMMAYRLACEAGTVFHGIMSVAGTDNTRQCAPAQPVPVLHIHARNDDRVLFNGGAGDKFRREAQVTDFVSVPATISRWVGFNHSAGPAQRTVDVPGAYCERHAAGPGGAPVQLCVTETGGHSWPGGNKHRGDEPPSQAINANDLMWEFFSSL